MSSVRLLAVTKPVIDGIDTLDQFVAFTARVSNPDNQLNTATMVKLIKYLLKHKHVSPFEMANMVLEIKTTRDIGRQILRHRSFHFQEWSQRYSKISEDGVFREARLQDPSNRQNSLPVHDKDLQNTWEHMQDSVWRISTEAYDHALSLGIAKEQARALLPEGMTPTTIHMNGNIRSWIFYVEDRTKKGAQKEHQELARKCGEILVEQFPPLKEILNWEINHG